jgi:hypothetical protein
MDERARRVGENEVLFRTVNEEVQALDRRFGARTGAQTMEIVCECGRTDCMERIELLPDMYEALRADGARFAVKPGHVVPEVEEVAERQDRYWVVRKREGGPAELARSADPRN